MPRKTIASISKHIFSGGTPSTTCDDYWGGDFNWLSSGETSCRYISQTKKHITQKGVENSSTRLANKGMIVMACAGQGHTRGQVSYLLIDTYINQSIIGIEIDSDLANPLYVFFYLSTKYDEIRKLSDGTGVRSSLTTKLIGELPIDLPDRSIQDKISSLMWMIDNIINVNETINDNLGKQCQYILTQYYDKYCTYASNIGELAEVIDCLHSKKPALQESGRRFIQLDNIRDDGLLDFSMPFWIKEEDYRQWISRCEVKERDIVITNVGRIGAVSQMPVGEKAAMGRNMTCIRPKKYPYFLIVSLLSPIMRSEIDYNTDSGTMMNALNVRNIPNLSVRIFDNPIQTELEGKLQAFRRMMENNLKETESLNRLRDYLLPKLLSGEIDVSTLDLPTKYSFSGGGTNGI